MITFKFISAYRERKTYVEGIIRKNTEPNIMFVNSFGWTKDAERNIRIIARTNIDVGEKIAKRDLS